jgi:eukaryotic-like serine/threonine-protein kinase
VAITDPLVLPPDVLLLPVAELSEDVRKRFTHEEGDVAITHPRLRTPSRVLDARSAELLAEFRAPRTIVEAVIRFSRAREADPEETLEQAYPMLQGLLESGFLVPEAAPEAAGILPSLRPGEEIGGFTVRECVRGLEDTEIHLVRDARGSAALKIERPSSAGKLGDLFAREGAILAALAGRGAPRLLAAGEMDGRRWLALEWIAGVDAATAAWELRQSGPAGRGELLALLRRIAAAYAGLHDRGVIHGDVHPQNAFVERDGGVRLLDFGYSRWPGCRELGLASPGRAGVAFFHEPEQAAAQRAGADLPDAAPAGEQYAVGALLYLLACGAHYRDFSLERAEMLRQIAEDPPLPFAERGAEPWPALEAVLARALRKEPAERFASMAGLAAALESADVPRVSLGGWGRPAGEAEGEALLQRVLERVGEGGAVFNAGLPAPPTATINYGAAGIACALYRIAQAREDAALLSLADVWAERAAAAAGPPESFYNPALEITEETVGTAAAYHGRAGILAQRALIAHALGFPGLQGEAVGSFLAEVRVPCENPDLTLGRSGHLLTGALLLDTLSGDAFIERRRELTAWGDELLRTLWAELSAKPEIGDAPSRPELGMAHGWTGYLYAVLRWCRATGAPEPAGTAGRLAELAACARPAGRGLRWKWYGTPEGDVSMPGWCNGSAGMVYLWTLAAERLGDPDGAFRARAEGAAWNTWEASDGNGNLCCGLAGRAYALLRLSRLGGGAEWLGRARILAGRAAVAIARSEAPDSLYKGETGVAALVADLARPESAALPFFEEEGWT